MNNIKSYLTAKELADMRLNSIPKTHYNVTKKAKRENWVSQNRKGKGGGKEYLFDGLPAEVQAEIIEKKELSIVNQAAKPRIKTSMPAVVDVNQLNDSQRQTADARVVMARYVLDLQETGLSRSQAIKTVSEQSQNDTLPEQLKPFALKAVAKQRKKAGFGTRSLHTWVLQLEQCNTSIDRLSTLSPQKMGKQLDMANLPWLADFMAIYRNKNGICITEAHRRLIMQYQAMGKQYPSISQVHRALSLLPKHIKEIGRKTGAELKALKIYQKRDWSTMQVNDVWVGDGHSMKMKVAHPDHGQPFTPELTLIIDAPSRFIVGWSLAYSESTIAVADALRTAMINHGIPAIYYSDNGGGQKNKILDADITGILPRLGIRHETGIPGNPQGRGIIERLNKTLALQIAREFETYYGAGADKETVRKNLTGVQSLQKAITQGKAELTPKQKRAQGKLPSWGQLIDAINVGVDWYNNEHVHREIGCTPAEMRKYLIKQADEPIYPITEAEARNLFRPEFVRKVQRGWLSLHNNSYSHPKLESFDGVEVKVAVDIHNPQTVIVREMDGTWICDAIFEGNKKSAFAESLVDKARKTRAKSAMARIQEKAEQVKAELTPAIEAQTNPFIIPQKSTPAITQEYDFLNPTRGKK